VKTVFDVLIEAIDEAHTRQLVVLERGSPKDFPEYREHVGILRGLAYAKQEIKNLQQRHRDNDDE
jgi:hypothetical protein